MVIIVVGHHFCSLDGKTFTERFFSMAWDEYTMAWSRYIYTYMLEGI